MQGTMREIFQWIINFNHKTTNQIGLDAWAFENLLMNADSASKCVSNQTIINHDDMEYKMITDSHSAISNAKEEFFVICLPPKVTFNTRNIATVYQSLYENCWWENEYSRNHYLCL